MFSKLFRPGSRTSEGTRQEVAASSDQTTPDIAAGNDADGPAESSKPPDDENRGGEGPAALDAAAPENILESGQAENGKAGKERLETEHPEGQVLSRPDGVDELWYKSVYRDVAAANISAVEHYRLYGWKEGRDPNPDFSTRWYVQEYPEVVSAGINPLVHFLEYGRKQGRRPRADGVAAQGSFFPKLGSPVDPKRPGFGTEGRAKIVFAGHNASRTGAPLSLLALVEHFARYAEQEIFIFLRAGGPLLELYRRHGHVIVHDGRPSASNPISAVIASLAHPQPKVAICNSIESWPLCSAFRGAKLKIISMVRESIRPYPAMPIQTLLECSDEIIFNALAMKDLAVEIDPRFENARTLPQGLHRPDFGTGDRTQARNWLREQLRLPDDAKVVLGCGSRTLGKGFDIFCQMASHIVDGEAGNVRFLWVGGSASNAPELHEWMKHDIKVLGSTDRITVIDAVEDTEPYFLAADAFVLTSRDDAFPNVVLQAMSAALPIVLFEQSGGGPEAIAGGCGLAVPYLNANAMAKAVAEVLTSAELAAQLGAKARDRVRSTYRFSEYADKIRSLAASLENSSVPEAAI
jgi:glycosyltransferase involved in cell wall biosynthesis